MQIHSKDKPDLLLLRKKIMVPTKIEKCTDPDGNESYKYQIIEVEDTGQDLTDTAVKTAITVQLNQLIAKTYRDELVSSNIVLFGSEWQVADVDRDRMRSAIETAERNNYAETETIGWILADNTVRDTTAVELSQVMDAYAYRMAAIFSAYKTWRAGNMSESFEYK